MVASQGGLLAKALELSQRRPLPDRDDADCRELAAELGAIDIRFEVWHPAKEPVVIIAYSRWGIPETYETQLTWAPDERVGAGEARLGEYFEYIDYGWWWVHW